MKRKQLAAPIPVLYEVENQYTDYLEGLPEEVKKRVTQQANQLKYGTHTISPLICPGPDKCPFLAFCPIPDREGKVVVNGPPSNYPVGKGCVIERLFIQQRLHDLVRYLEVDLENPIELAIANSLALIDMQKNRATMFLSCGDRNGAGQDFMKTDIVGFTDSGAPLESTKIHPLVEFQDRLEKQRMMWLDRLSETRKAKAEILGRTGEQDGRLLGQIQIMSEALARLNAVPGQIAGKEILLSGQEDE